MNKLIYITFILISSLGFAQENDLFTKGNTLYNDGKFQDAIQVYESVISNNKQSAELYFNLANAYYKTNQVAPSIYYYEKALQLAPNDKDIKGNLAFAQNMTIDAIDTIPQVGFSKLIKNTINTFSFDVWSILSVIFVLFFVILFLAYYFSYGTNRKRLMFVSSFAFLCLGCLTLLSAFQKFNYEKNDRPAIVFAEESLIKAEPNVRSESPFSLHEGTKVQVLEDYNEHWTKIKLSDGKTGWIAKADIKLLDNF